MYITLVCSGTPGYRNSLPSGDNLLDIEFDLAIITIPSIHTYVARNAQFSKLYHEKNVLIRNVLWSEYRSARSHDIRNCSNQIGLLLMLVLAKAFSLPKALIRGFCQTRKKPIPPYIFTDKEYGTIWLFSLAFVLPHEIRCVAWWCCGVCRWPFVGDRLPSRGTLEVLAVFRCGSRHQQHFGAKSYNGLRAVEKPKNDGDYLTSPADRLNLLELTKFDPEVMKFRTCETSVRKSHRNGRCIRESKAWSSADILALKPFRMLTSMCAPHGPKNATKFTFLELKKKLETAYAKKLNKRAKMAHFFLFRQKPGQSLIEFSNDVRIQYVKCGYPWLFWMTNWAHVLRLDYRVSPRNGTFIPCLFSSVEKFESLFWIRPDKWK